MQFIFNTHVYIVDITYNNINIYTLLVQKKIVNTVLESRKKQDEEAKQNPDDRLVLAILPPSVWLQP